MASVIIYVEGGGRPGRGRQLVRLAFQEFLSEFRGSMPDVRARGGRDEAKDAFLAALQTEPGVVVMLLVDAEAVANVPSPKRHLLNRDGWQLGDASDAQVHLMVQAVEAWMIADRAALRAHFGQGFNENALPNTPPEDIPKDDLKRALKKAGRQTLKEGYDEIADGTKIIASLDPATVRTRCVWCRRLFKALSHVTGVALPDLQ